MFLSSSGFQFLDLPETLQRYQMSISKLLIQQKLIAKSGNELSKYPWQSRIGGMPYLPKGATNPLENDKLYGDHLIMLFQINFEEISQLPGFPSKGILQFFTLFDEPYEEISNLIYYPEIVSNLDALRTDFSNMRENLRSVVDKTPEEGINVKFKSCDFSLLEGDACHSEIQRLFLDIQNEKERRSLIDDLCTYLDQLNLAYDELQNSVVEQAFDGCTIQIGGNVGQFWNGDPRTVEDEGSKYDRLMIEYYPEQEMEGSFALPLQGQDIKCQFFINEDDFKNFKFDNYLYHSMM